ncbi:MAG: hypothetical protein COU47_04195 [Candidatus Niyogibacteria bacterium CG10_big_fil_rev_8_21_14_0_10_46_36]|uniref:Type 4a pilus biogenesis protein PilO n=1 Tax=Candidatus Niyogibacteria bacterium CG10_big_fil_rev_8_21_14_0_10_46_36 TaxID=1974726 RepID=A0A2H0TCI3_9BACT|nr:MAG: hypothetical protein COU47_04195 [Candidatus Niyogibacteria bacterium CG10_big_fil_rev_8_21_14_0_10_46_36]
MRKSITIIIGVIVLLAFLAWLGRFFVAKISEKQQHLVDIQTEIERMGVRQQNLKDLEILFDEVQQRKDEIDSVFINERSVVRVIESFEARARELGVELEVESASLPTASAARGPEIQLHLEGSFDALYRYIKVLEVMPFQISIDLVNINKRSSAEGPGWAATIRLTVLSFLSQLP